MTLTVIDLHDVAVTVTSDGAVRARSPGLAILDRGRVLSGQAAIAQLEHRPRSVYWRFWQALDQQPLAGGARACRHHADLAWAHLRETLRAAGHPRRAIVAVPGHYDDAQLALLLGVATAAGLTVDALVDNAVAALAGSAGAGRYCVVDLRQGHVLVSDVTVGPRWVERERVTEVADGGLLAVHQAALELVAAALLREARFDALHDADSAQALKAQVPAWLAQAATGADVHVDLLAGGRRRTARIPAAAFAGLGATLARTIAPHLAGGSTVVLAEHLAAVPGTREALAPALSLPPDAVWRGVAEHAATLVHHATGSALYTTLSPTRTPRLAPLAAAPRPRAHAPTHVLAGHTAHRLGAAPLHLCADGTLAHNEPASALATLTSGAGDTVLAPLAADVWLNGCPVTGPRAVSAGDRIACGAAGALFVPIVVETPDRA